MDHWVAQYGRKDDLRAVLCDMVSTLSNDEIKKLAWMELVCRFHVHSIEYN